MTNSEPKHVTQADVAQKAGISRSVVSYVINNGPRTVSNETRKRVLEAIEALNYRPNKYAQRLIQEKWGSVAEKQIGIVMSSGVLFERPYYGAILAGIQESAHNHHYHIRFIRVFESFKNPVLLNQLVVKNEISGLLLLSLDQVLESESDFRLLEHIVQRVDNIVCIDWEYKNLSSVNFDRYTAAYKATSHLLNLGHRSIAYIGPDDKRIHGFQAALSEHGLESYIAGLTDTAQGGYQKAEVDSLATFSALVAGTDEVAFGILKYCKDKALDVPKDMALVSIDNIALSAFANPPLTTIDVPQKAIGERAIQMLIKGNENTAQNVMLPIELIIRESCGSKLPLD